MSFEYVEHSRDLVAGLDPEQIGAMTLGDVTFDNGFFARHALGRVEVDGEPLYLAVDLPLRRCTAQSLLLTNMHQIRRMLDVAPDMAQYAPSFIGAVASGEERRYWAGAVLTEDMTEGGRYPLTETTPSDELVKKGVRLAVEQGGPHALATARPGGHEKIVSFFPDPFRMLVADRDEYDDTTKRNQERLTVEIPDSSALSNEITGYRHRPAQSRPW